MNSSVKHLVERGLTASGLRRLGLRRHRRRTLVLAYHNVVVTGDVKAGDASLHLSQREFAWQLDCIAESHEVVPLAALFDSYGDSERPRAVITFDDAYSGALTAGVNELVKRGMPATIFVAPAMLASIPWWDVLADPGQQTVPENLRSHALRDLSGKRDAVLRSLNPLSSDRRATAGLPRIGTDQELANAASQAVITFGSHTWSHPNLCALDEPELDTELRWPLDWLRSRFPCTIPWLSYPYGMHNSRVRSAAMDSGYIGAFRIDGGWLPTKNAPSSFALPRLNIPSGLSHDGFMLRVAGL